MTNKKASKKQQDDMLSLIFGEEDEPPLCRSMRNLYFSMKNNTNSIVVEETQKVIEEMPKVKDAEKKESELVNSPTSITKNSTILNVLNLIHISDLEAGGFRNIKNENYFVGYLPKDEIGTLLKKDGQFFVRMTIDQTTISEIFIISCFFMGNIYNIQILFDEDFRFYYLNKYCFDSIPSLIAYHSTKSIPLNDDKDFLIIKLAAERPKWLLYHGQLDKIGVLGEGAYGQVAKCFLQTGLVTEMQVAVKSCIINSDQNSENEIQIIKTLYIEAKNMQNLNHSNIVKLIGVAVFERPPLIVIEFCPGGSVLDLVQEKPGPTLEYRKRLIVGAARGLAYLEENTIVHRDVAARNVLIGRYGEAKIGDFGLSIMQKNIKVTQLKRMPFRYLAPETLKDGQFSSCSDVFSFGVYIWEVFQNGRIPWEDHAADEAFRRLIVKGGRLKNIDNLCPPEFWNLALRCFKKKPGERPTFQQIIVEYAKYDSLDYYERQKHWWWRTKLFFNYLFFSSKKSKN